MVVPEAFDYPQMVGPAQPRLDRLVFEYLEVGQYDVHYFGPHATIQVPGAYPFQESVHLHSGEVRRGHLKLGLLNTRIPVRHVNHTPIDPGQSLH